VRVRQTVIAAAALLRRGVRPARRTVGSGHTTTREQALAFVAPTPVSLHLGADDRNRVVHVIGGAEEAVNCDAVFNVRIHSRRFNRIVWAVSLPMFSEILESSLEGSLQS
jgi:hypothetical protein